MPIAYTHAETKDRIVSIIKSRGPSLPVQIAKALNISPLFASAFLSELYNEGRLLTTYMRVGSSPLYLVSSQEAQLERFVQYLNQKEREAFAILQRGKVLDDEYQLPAIRVALRAIKDFALPVKIKSGDQLKLYWKYFLIQDSEIKSILETNHLQSQPIQIQTQPQAQLQTSQLTVQTPQPSQTFTQSSEIPEIKLEIQQAQQVTQAVSTQVQQIANQIDQIQQIKAPQEIKLQQPQVQAQFTQIQNQIEQQLTSPQKTEHISVLENEKIKKKVVLKDEPSQFQTFIKEYLKTKNIEIQEIYIDKKKELTARITIDTVFGKQEFYIVAKDKKKISETDLSNALDQAKSIHMPAVFLSSGDLDKKAKEYHKVHKNMIKTEKVNISQ